MRRINYAVTALLLFSQLAWADTPSLDWSAALSGEHRSEASRQRDQYRHPRQTLSFFGVKPCDTVVELWPGGGWYTEVLAPALRDCGKLVAAHFAADSPVAFYRRSRGQYDAMLAGDPARYDRVRVTALEPPEHVQLIDAETADSVLTFRNVHNWLKAGTASAVFSAAYQALKPGGIFGVVEHRAHPGTSLERMVSSGYVTEELVIELARNAGFLLLSSSEINANPKDSRDHPKGVWTLPPSLRLGDRQREYYQGIGESDRMTLKFIKPIM